MKFSPTIVSSPYNVAQINDNFARISQQLQNKVWYRNNPNGEPNTLESDIDLNSHRLYNGAWPLYDGDLVTKEYVDWLFAGGTGPGGGSGPPGVVPGPGNGGDGGTGSPGGIGQGDGGYDTPIDPTIGQPTIVFPEFEEEIDIDEDYEAESDEFNSSNSQTHIKSRWMIEQVGVDGVPLDGASIVVYDSGPTEDNLTILPFLGTDIGLGHELWYAIRVRYKGSDGGWSAWSDDQYFQTTPCPETGGGTLPEGTWDEIHGLIPLRNSGTSVAQIYPEDTLTYSESDLFTDFFDVGFYSVTRDGTGFPEFLDSPTASYADVQFNWVGGSPTPTLSGYSGDLLADGIGVSTRINLGITGHDPHIGGGILRLRGSEESKLELVVTITNSNPDFNYPTIAWEYNVLP